MSSKIIVRMNEQNELVKKAYSVFDAAYGTAMKKIYVSDLINGENIDVKPENITIDECDYIDNNFDKKQQYCTKKLFAYQKKAIMKLRELELNGYTIDPIEKQKIISNAWLLFLPIGSGKSLVFMFLSLFYRTVPCHPIIISKSGSRVPIHEPMQWKYYPFYYEQCSYIEDDKTESAVVTYKNYNQRKTTIILTHNHLMSQMKDYFETDFPKMVAATKIAFYYNLRQPGIDMEKDIIVVPANEENMDVLVSMSYEQPFMRVIIDDYTSMVSIENFRQILASSTIFVSGSGFERDFDSIPASYYTMKYDPVSKLSLVGKPEETYEGILRDNIATLKLLGSSCEFSVYSFVKDLEETCKGYYKEIPPRLYPLIMKESIVQHFLALKFVIANRYRIKNAITNIDRDYNISDLTKDSKYSRDEISYFLEWKSMLKNNKVNPLFDDLFTPGTCSNTEASPIVQQQCINCHKEHLEHGCYGAISCCCGAFYCEKCLKNMATRKIVDSKSNKHMIDHDNYYCSCCRRKNPVFFVNMTKKKDRNVFAYNLIDTYFDTTDLKNHIKFDYYYYMFLKGFKPLYFEGIPVDIKYEVSTGIIDRKCFTKKQIPEFQNIYAKDQLLIKAIKNIADTLDSLNIKFTKIKPIILFYSTPDYIEPRLKTYFQDLCRQNPKSSINDVGLMFKKDMSTLIGMQKVILGIVEWENNSKGKDEDAQRVGRLLRISGVKLPLYFYIKADVLSM